MDVGAVRDAPHSGATTGDAIIFFLQGFEASPLLYLALLAFIAIGAILITRLARYLLPRDFAKMIGHLSDGLKLHEQKKSQPDLIDRIEDQKDAD